MTDILDVLESMRPPVPERWVSRTALRRVRSAAASLPVGSPVCFLERPFSKGKGRVDFGLCYPHPTHRTLLSENETLIDQVPFLWLEVDQAPARERSSPGVLLCLDRGLSHAAFGRAVPRLTEERLLALASAAHRQFLSEALSPPVERRLRTCFKELPARGSLLHLCFMPSRNPPVMKVNVSLPKHTLASYLRRVEWPGSFSALKEVWKAIAPSLRTAKIDLTLSPTLSPKLGLEVHPFNTPVEGRRRVLEWLESEKLADRTLCEDLAAWHGAKRTGLRGKSTSVELDFGMKLVLGEGDSIRAKAYWQVACDSLAAGAGSHV